MKGVFSTAVLGAYAVAAVAAAANPSWVLDSTSVELQVYSSYSYRLVERATGNVLLSQNQTSFTLPSSTATASSLGSVTLASNTLAGTLTLSNGQTGQLQFSFPTPDRLQVSMSLAGTQPTAISERFTDQNEHYYGIWETAYPTNLDNRGVTANYDGLEPQPAVKGVFASSARAPFYMTSKNVGVYVPTQATGTYNFAVTSHGNTNTSFSFNQSTLSYNVMYGTDYKQVLSQYRAVAGPALMPPDWAFGTIFWRDDWTRLPLNNDGTRAGSASNAQQLVAEDATKLQQYRIPSTAVWLDRPYGSGNPGFAANVGGWGNMDYDPTQFPAPSAMAQDLQSHGMKLMVWIANKANNALYTQGSAAGYLFPGAASTAPAVDLTNPAAYAWMQGQIANLLNAAKLADGSAGISGFKIDRAGEGEMPTNQINTQTTLFQRLASDALAATHPGDTFQFARNINDTGRQYAAVWSGDAGTSWTGFQTAIRNGVRSGLIYFPMWGSDSGGYSGGAAPPEELFIRWLGFSTYCPMMEVLQDRSRNIWYNYSPALLSATVADTQTHQDLIPYTRSLVYQAVNTGTPAMRAMFLEFPTDTAAADLGDQYMYGPSLLVAPISVQGATSRSVYLPAGKWLDYNDRVTVYTGSQTIAATAATATTPVFVREGAIVPRGDIVQGNNNWTANWSPTLRIEIFPSPAVDGNFSYYTGTAAVTLSSRIDGDLLRYVAPDLGNPGSTQFYLGRFFTMTSITSITLNGIKLAASDYTYDAANSILTVPFSAGADIRVRLAASPTYNQWVAGNGTFIDSARWTKTSVPNAADRVAAFLASPGTATTVTVNSAVTLGDLHLASANAYTFSGTGSITMASVIATVATIDIDSGHHTLSVPLTAQSNTTITAAAGATLNTAAMTVVAGRTLELAGQGAITTGDIANPGNLLLSGSGGRTMGTIDGATGTTAAQLSAAGTTTLGVNAIASASRLRQSTLTLHGDASHAAAKLILSESVPRLASGYPAGDNAMVSVVRSLSVDHTGSTFYAALDLTNNDLIIDYTGDSPYATIEAAVRSGYAGGAWDGPGLNSSDAAALNYFTLLVLDNATMGRASFDGVTIDSSTIIVKFTHQDDLNGDGLVNATDKSILTSHWSDGVTGATHRYGDMDFDGVYTFNDVQLFNLYYNVGLPSLPEPGSLALLALGAAGLLSRKWKQMLRPPGS